MLRAWVIKGSMALTGCLGVLQLGSPSTALHGSLGHTERPCGDVVADGPTQFLAGSQHQMPGLGAREQVFMRF